MFNITKKSTTTPTTNFNDVMKETFMHGVAQGAGYTAGCIMTTALIKSVGQIFKATFGVAKDVVSGIKESNRQSEEDVARAKKQVEAAQAENEPEPELYGEDEA